MGDDSENVRVAVRVRPFNSREKDRKAKLIVRMSGNTTELRDPNSKEEPKKFSFDFSYWSHDGFEEDSSGYLNPTSSKYADQKTVFKDLGQGILNNAWNGFNTTLFAYGQTGSGKSYSIVGYGVNRGVVPMLCEKLFQGIQEKKQEEGSGQFEVTFSMLEIYNENVRDLLSTKGGNLKVRQHPQLGFYPDGLKTTPVGSFNDIERHMEEGTKHRTIAATQMNATSSRAHTIVGVTFIQKNKDEEGNESAKSSTINLVDLAGSERAESTGATGDRLKEGAAINQSLSSLGNVIAALAEQSKGKSGVRVPFRDSVLTKLLKNALGGNSKTIMIAAISPADINYDETLSTLRYADRAKQIKTKAVINENPTDKLIRELRAENARLMALLSAEGGDAIALLQEHKKASGGGEDSDDDEDYSELDETELRKKIEEEVRASLLINSQMMTTMTEDFDEKVTEVEEDPVKLAAKSTPHLANLNVDPQLSGMIIQLVEEGESSIGNKNADPAPTIVLNGLNIVANHAKFVNEGHDLIILNKLDNNARVLVNGVPISDHVEMHHNDRVMFGSNHLYMFQNPKEYEEDPKKFTEFVNYDMAQAEIAKKSGFDLDARNLDQKLLQESMMELIPAVEEANAISEELDKKVKFEVVIVSPKARGELIGKTEVCVKMRNLVNDLEWVWPKNKFINRKYLMQEMYQNFQENQAWEVPEERDPFTESLDTEVHIGSVSVYLESLAYLIESQEQLDITDVRGKEIGVLNIAIMPTHPDGREMTEAENLFLDTTQDLIGSNLNFYILVQGARGLPNKYREVSCRYKFFLEEEFTTTHSVKGTVNPDWDHLRRFQMNPCTSQLVNYLSSSNILVQVWGKYKDPGTVSGKNTRELMRTEMLARGRSFVGGSPPSDSGIVSLKLQIAAMKKRHKAMENKMGLLKKLLEAAETNSKENIPTDTYRQMLHANNPTLADRIILNMLTQRGQPGGPQGPDTHGQQMSPERAKQSSTCEIL